MHGQQAIGRAFVQRLTYSVEQRSEMNVRVVGFLGERIYRYRPVR
jgi:hypothetical protein